MVLASTRTPPALNRKSVLFAGHPASATRVLLRYPTVHAGHNPRTSTVLRSGSNPSRAASRPSVRSMPGSWISAADSHFRQIRN